MTHNARFLSRLADTGNVLGVCREMGLSRQSVYALRARNAAFARAWQGAMLQHRDAPKKGGGRSVPGAGDANEL
ncbi:hypothetical protein [Parasphingopyxis lamellibrachiae]|uniref:Uncharacterized protein n=1 Tax=Parasphingopyxis lamellibrachiae TaxID=680125 RepID=A0A3D9FGD2_9SPHN|nr:hypothetical protein [Parasphingopyxis lamellibrachiae]RED16833.1 hypothetical protein DFR46_1865 [Parasphingopyxis lamellibrachiae]